MASTIVTKNSSTASAVPVAGDLTKGELAVNVTDKKLYTKDNGGSVVKLVGGLGNQEANAVAITGGAIDGTAIGGTTASTASFTTVSASGNVTLSGGTANGVAYLNGSKVVTSGSALTFDGTNLQVGGNSQPIIRAVSSSTNNATARMFTDGDTVYLGSLNTSTTGGSVPVVFQIGGSEQMRLTSTGLGIGTSSPGYKLDVQAATAVAQVKSTTGTNASYYIANNTGGDFYIGRENSAGTTFGTTAYSAVLWSAGAYPMVFFTNGNERMRIDSSGNLGLGVTPSAWYGTVRAMQFGTSGSIEGRSNNSSYLAVGTNYYLNSASATNTYANTAAAAKYEQDAGVHKWSYAASGTAGNAISFTQAMTLDASGNLLVGTTSQIRTGDRMSVAGTGTTVATFQQNTNTSGYHGISVNLPANGNNTSTYAFWGNTSGVGNWYLYGNGTTSYSSDERLKKNIVTTRDGYIDDVMKLRVVKYNWKKDDDATPKELGLIAQEVEQVFPGLVQDDINPVEEGGEIYKQVKQSVLPFILLKAIQEQQALIQQLTARVAQLEGK